MLHWLKKIFSAKATTLMELGTGEGTLSCDSCGHEETVRIFTHGFGPTSRCTTGVQCQSCAKLVTFNSEPVGESGLPALEALIEASRCECGGEFARDKQVVCPRCKSASVQYAVEWMT